jgi:NADP-dependent isocitrate dehydrogenase
MSATGSKIDYRDGRWIVPDDPIIPFIEGDGTGPDIWRASRRVFDAAVAKAAGGGRRVVWREVLAGEKAFTATGNWLPEETLAAIREHRVAIKGPLTTPVGGGIRSLNVALRQLLDLYACIRPVRWFAGVPAPVKHPEKLDVVIFRENIEDVYAGIEYKAESPEARALIDFLTERLQAQVRSGSAIGIKPMSRFGSQRLMAKAVAYALRTGRPSVTLVHKGNIMKFTEGVSGLGYEAQGAVHIDGAGGRDGKHGTGGDHQGPHRRRDVPAGAAAPGRVFGDRHAEPERRLPLRRVRRAGRRARPRRGRQRRGRVRRLRGHTRHGAQVRQPRQINPGSVILRVP